MYVQNHKTYLIRYDLIVGDILEALEEDLLYSYPRVSSNLSNLIEGMEFDTKYLYLNAVNELDPSNKDYGTKVDKMYKAIPKIILDKYKVIEVMDEWFDDNYDSDIYVTKDLSNVFCALINQLSEYESEILTVEFRNYVDTCNKKVKSVTSQYLNNDAPAKCKGCSKLYACKLVGQGFTDICRHKEQTSEGSSPCRVSA